MSEIKCQSSVLDRSQPQSEAVLLLRRELKLAAGMAAASCRIMIWQQALAARKRARAKRMAQSGIRELQQLEQDFGRLWPQRNKVSPLRSSPFFQWRIADYLCARLHFAPEVARLA